VGDFARDTRVEAVEGTRFRASLHPDWEIWGPNGGYLAAIALRAAGAVARVQRPVAFYAHFLSVARFDEVSLEVVPLRQGRRAESLRVSLSQRGKPVLEGLLKTASEGPGLEHEAVQMPQVARPEALASIEELLPSERPRYAFWKNLESRPLRPERVGRSPEPREAQWREWYRFRPRACFDDPWVDAARLLLLIDTLSWPAAVGPHPETDFVAPNLDVVAWFHAFEPESEWLLADVQAPLASAGLIGTTARVWSRSGRLLASGGAQLLCAPAVPDG